MAGAVVLMRLPLSSAKGGGFMRLLDLGILESWKVPREDGPLTLGQQDDEILGRRSRESRVAENSRMRPLVAHCHLGLGELYRRTGKREKAQGHLTTATALYREMDMRFWLEQAEAEINASRRG
jgi:hypothetical protein